jgi:site-specific DNA recombinase
MNKFTPAVSYTRISVKEGTKSKLNIETQKKYCDKYAKQNELRIIACFGGTFDSIKTDGYKEFRRMLSFARKQNLSYIIVYSLDRISGSVPEAVNTVENLKKSGIYILSVTKNIETEIINFQPSRLFTFSSQSDCELRREKI